MRLLIKYATRGRPIWFKKVIENIISTISTTDFKILVSADSDDASMNNHDIKNFVSTFVNIQIFYGDSKSKIEAINKDMEYSGEWDLLINMSDDMHFVVKGWDIKMVDCITKVWGYSLDFFAHFNDGYVGEALPTMSIMGRTYYERDGYIYHPSYKSFSSDAEAMYVAMMRGRHHYFKDVLFLHQNHKNRPARNDKTYTINSKHTAHDTKNYFQRLTRYFDEPIGRQILKARPELKQYL